MDKNPEKIIYEGVPRESPSESKNIHDRIDTLISIRDGFSRMNKILDDAKKDTENGSAE